MEGLTLHPACIRCKKKNTLEKDIVLEDGTTVFKAGEFPIQCKGIPADFGQVVDKVLGDKRSFFDKNEVEMLEEGLDATKWAKKWLLVDKGGWEPRGCTPPNKLKYDLDDDADIYQEIMLKCTAKRKVFRIGRRGGKTESICVKMLHLIDTWPTGHCKILLVCPFRSQIDIIYKRLNELIADSPRLKNLIKRKVSNPYHEIEFTNGSYIRGFSAGTNSGANASSVRGQGGDVIVLDETDYMNPGDIDSIAAILMDHEDTQLWASSTPTGRRDKFYEWSFDPEYKNFHFPSMANPNWTHRMDLEFRRTLTKGGYIHEVLAEFGDDDAGVFRKKDIDYALKWGGNYDYDDSYHSQINAPGWAYTIGVDWNPVKGTEVMVLGIHRYTKEEAELEGDSALEGEAFFRVVDSKTVERQEFTERAANLEIIRMNRKWAPFAIYLDYGGGGVNHLEQLRIFSATKPDGTADGRIKHITKSINFSGNIEAYDPWSKKKTKKRAKQMMIENAQRKFEQHKIQLTQADPILTKQLENYIISRVTQTGIPVYEMQSDAVGDHKLDALVLALLAVQMEATQFGKPRHDAKMRVAPGLGQDIETSVIEELGKAGVSTKQQLKLELAPQPRAVNEMITPRTVVRRSDHTHRFANDRDHEKDWDRRLLAQRKSKVNRGKGFGRLRNSRGPPRRSNF